MCMYWNEHFYTAVYMPETHALKTQRNDMCLQSHLVVK